MRVVQKMEPGTTKVDSDFGRAVERIEFELLEARLALENALERLDGLHEDVGFIVREGPEVLSGRVRPLRTRVAVLVGRIGEALVAQQELTNLIDGLDIRKLVNSKEK